MNELKIYVEAIVDNLKDEKHEHLKGYVEAMRVVLKKIEEIEKRGN